MSKTFSCELYSPIVLWRTKVKLLNKLHRLQTTGDSNWFSFMCYISRDQSLSDVFISVIWFHIEKLGFDKLSLLKTIS